MAFNVKISQLISGGTVTSQDDIPVARGLETFRIAANQFVINGSNLGPGGQVFLGKQIGNGSTLQFRSLSGSDGITVNTFGNTLVISASAQNFIKTTLTGDGITTAFNVNGVLSSNPNSYRVDIDGVLQEPGVDYIISNRRLVFITPPPSGSKIVVVAVTLLKINEAEVADGTITAQKISLEGPYWDSTGRVGVKTRSPNTDLTVFGSISASNQIQATTLLLNNVPTLSTGLPQGSIWRDIPAGNVLRIVP